MNVHTCLIGRRDCSEARVAAPWEAETDVVARRVRAFDDGRLLCGDPDLELEVCLELNQGVESLILTGPVAVGIDGNASVLGRAGGHAA